MTGANTYDSSTPPYPKDASPAKHPEIRGVVARAERHEKHQAFFGPSNSTANLVTYSIEDAGRDVDDGLRAADRFGADTTVITTTTIHDDDLRQLSWKRELEIVRSYQPDFHIPTEYSVYERMSIPKQERSIRDCLEGTEWMAHQLRDSPIQVLVQLKGWKKWHFQLSKHTLDALNADFGVFYGTYYPSITELVEDVKRAIEVTGVSKILLLGRQSPNQLKRFPPEVVAAEGRRWARKLRISGFLEANFETFKEPIEAELGSGQSTLGSSHSRR